MAHLKADTALLGNNKELNEFLEPNKAATLRISDHSPEEVYDYFLNFFNIKVCGYFDLNSKRPTFDPNRSLVLLHINIRLLHKNFDNLYDFLVELNFLPDLICLTIYQCLVYFTDKIKFKQNAFSAMRLLIYAGRQKQKRKKCFSECLALRKYVVHNVLRIGSNRQWWILGEANEAVASGPPFFGPPPRKQHIQFWIRSVDDLE